MHRTDNLKWDEYFMGIAVLSALAEQRSFDPSGRLHRRCQNHKVVSIGYNGMPRGVDDESHLLG
jgi:dCMP deaminase